MSREVLLWSCADLDLTAAEAAARFAYERGRRVNRLQESGEFTLVGSDRLYNVRQWLFQWRVSRIPGISLESR